MKHRSTAFVLSTVLVAACRGGADDASVETTSSALTADQMIAPLRDDEGRAQTATPSGSIDTSNPFFQSLGTNGRTCNSCHQADQGWSITPAGLRARFEATGGTDPIFNRLDGADSPTAAYDTVAEKRAASANLLARGVIRVGLPKTRPAPTWDIDIEVLADPRNTNALTATNGQVSFFRRPLPTANLRFTAAINWDGRNTPDLTNMRPGLLAQANGATTGHAQGHPIGDDVRAAIVDFELGLANAQIETHDAGILFAAGAKGGPQPLLTQSFAIGPAPAGPVFDLYDAWARRPMHGRNEGRADVAAGQKVFEARCASCHDAANVGSGTTFAFFDDGISDASRWKGNVPLYRVRQRSNPASSVVTTDPGRAMITGQFADVNKFKVPNLRGLAARAPYFHDGSARSIEDVVDHYEDRLGIHFRNDEKDQLVAFLYAL
jgi:cytochrome c peroxidase